MKLCFADTADKLLGDSAVIGLCLGVALDNGEQKGIKCRRIRREIRLCRRKIQVDGILVPVDDFGCLRGIRLGYILLQLIVGKQSLLLLLGACKEPGKRAGDA